MAAWSMTIAQMQNSIATLFKTMTGRKVCTYSEREAIRFAINEALQRLCEERGVQRWRFMQEAVSVSTVANQAYVDLADTVLNIVSGTERIPAEESQLAVTSLEALTTANIDQSETGLPMAYALDTSTTGSIRLQLYPIPDQVYAISLVCETIQDEDSVTGIPAWMTGAIMDLSTSISMKRLGFGNPGPYEASYEDTVLNHANKQGYDGPVHVNRSSGLPWNAWSRAMHNAITS